MLLKQVVLLGAGNVGYHLGRQIHQCGLRVVQVFSRDYAKARVLARELKAFAINDLKEVESLDNCLYVLAVKDDAIAHVANQLASLSSPDRLFVHTSGAVPIIPLQKTFEKAGVFYPLQTFSKDRQIEFRNIPICVDATDQQALQALQALARQFSDTVEVINDHQRKVLHIAAVFVNNFSNHLFHIGKELAETEQISFDLLRPLIAETAAKVMANDPALMQTGPAKRKDQQTILSHLRYLQKFPNYQDIYRILSHSIGEQFSKNKKS